MKTCPVRTKYLLLISILFFFSLGSFQMTGCKNVIVGTVTDSYGNPVKGAVVSIEGYSSDITDVNGEYIIVDVAYEDGIIVTATHGDSDTASTTTDTSYFTDGFSCEDTTVDIQFGSSWTSVGTSSDSGGGISNNTGTSTKPSLAIDPDGHYILAWSDNSSGTYEIYVKEWDGTSWNEIGTGSASGGGISNTAEASAQYGDLALAINNLGNPVVAWDEYDSPNSFIYLRQWNGTSWEELGGSASGVGVSTGSIYVRLALTIDGDGNPVIAWEDDRSTAHEEIYVKRWNDSSWEELGGSATNGGISNNEGRSLFPHAATNAAGYPVVTWINYPPVYLDSLDIFIREWTGTSWDELGQGSAEAPGINLNFENGQYPKVAVNSDGDIYVAWEDWDSSEGENNIYVKMFNGTSWEDPGNNFTSDTGISSAADDAHKPGLAIDNSGNPVVAWKHEVSETWDVYISKWDGSEWVDIGPGSSSGRGISNTAGNVNDISVIIKSDGNPVVAWKDNTDGDDEIYVKQYAPGN